MTTPFRAVPSRPRAGERSSNFHEPAALDSYASHFHRIGIASVAAAAAQVKRVSGADERNAQQAAIALLQRWEDDAA